MVSRERSVPQRLPAELRASAQLAANPIRVRTRVRYLRDETAGVGPLWDSSGMARFGYARVSTPGQKDDSQIDALTAAGCERTGWIMPRANSRGARSGTKCFDYLRRGDELVITRLSRPFRSVRHMTELAAQLDERGGWIIRTEDTTVTCLYLRSNC